MGRFRILVAVAMVAGVVGAAIPTSLVGATIPNNVDQNFITGASTPFGVAVDADHIYWTNTGTGTIGQANLDGTGAVTLITGASEPSGIVVDADHIYWANQFANSIGRANLDGTDVTQSFISLSSGPVGIAVDANYIYWTSGFGDTMGRANLADGSGVNESFITGTPNATSGLAVDGSYIYWANEFADTISRANLDGTGVTAAFITSSSQIAGLDVDAGHIYWANNAGTTIGRANIDGTDATDSFVTGANAPVGVWVDPTYIYWSNSGASTIGRARLLDVPGAPVIGTATAGDASASVAFTAPATDGGSSIMSYTATCTEGGGGTESMSGTSSPIVVPDLTNGDVYTCSVTATNTIGTGPASGLSNPVTPIGPAPMVSVVLDASPDGSGGWFKTAPVPGHVSATAFGGGTVSSIDCNVTTVASGLGTASASATFSVSSQGVSSVSCTATDSFGSTSPPASVGVMVDTIAPTGAVTVDGGATTTGNTAATLGVSATDAVGVVAYRVANGADCSAAAWVPVSSTTSLASTASLTLVSGVGAKTVCVQYQDVAGNTSANATATIGLLGVTQLATGTDHSCALMTDGTARCWGSNMFGQLGDGTTTNRLVPVVVQNQTGTGPLTDITQISAGASHTCVVRSSGSARCWGLNTMGELGDGTTTNRLLPVVVKDPTGTTTLSGVAQLSLSGVYSCARMTDGTARCWGNNFNGQLGDGTTTNRLLPVTVQNQTGTGPLTDISQMSIRGVHSCALRNSGSVRCWGNNGDGRLGDGTTTTRLLPVVVKDPTGTTSLTGVISIVNGSTYTCAVINDGTARCWGDNAAGELGDGTTTDRLLPVVVQNQTGTGPLNTLVAIAAGSQHTCALRSVGSARCWGSNANGQLGNGTTTSTLLPVVVTNLNSITQISLRNDTSSATMSDSTARCWGNNMFGQLGDGTTTTQPLAVPVYIP